MVAVAFRDRVDAGEHLARALEAHRDTDAVVLGLARGGVVLGYAIATALRLTLRALVVRKIGAPQNPELALGAVSETGVRWLDARIIEATGASEAYLQGEIEAQMAEARRRQQAYAAGAGLETVRDRPAIVVDDGIATGSTALVAVRSARDLAARTVVLATPVASAQAVRTLRPEVDELVVLATPDPFLAVGFYYERFDQVGDDEVISYLTRAAQEEESTR